MQGGPPPKPAHLRQRRNKPKTLAVVRNGGLSRRGYPACPPELLPEITERWDTLWTESPLREAFQITDIPALRRLFVFYDEWERTYREMRQEPPQKPVQGEEEPWNDFQVRMGDWARKVGASERIIRGEKGGLRINPLINYMEKLEQRIVALEDRFGFNLQTRQKLGLNDLRARTLAEQNAETMREDDEHVADSEFDPVAPLLVTGTNTGGPPASEPR